MPATCNPDSSTSKLGHKVNLNSECMCHIQGCRMQDAACRIVHSQITFCTFCRGPGLLEHQSASKLPVKSPLVDPVHQACKQPCKQTVCAYQSEEWYKWIIMGIINIRAKKRRQSFSGHGPGNGSTGKSKCALYPLSSMLKLLGRAAGQTSK